MVSTLSMVIREPWSASVTRFLRTSTHDGDANEREWRALDCQQPSHAMLHLLPPLYTMNFAKTLHKQVALSKPHHSFQIDGSSLNATCYSNALHS